MWPEDLFRGDDKRVVGLTAVSHFHRNAGTCRAQALRRVLHAILVDVLANDTDVDDGHALSLVSAAAPSGKGSASIVAGQVQFNPGTDFDHLAQGAL